MEKYTSQLIQCSENLLKAIKRNQADLWEDSLERTHEVIVLDKCTMTDEDGNETKYRGIIDEWDALMHLCWKIKHEQGMTMNEYTEEFLESRGYKEVEFAINDICDALFVKYSDLMGDADISQVEDFIHDILEPHYESDIGCYATDGEQDLWMDNGDILQGLDWVVDELDKLPEYIRTGGL